jgi:hypothetical protein
MTGHLFDALNFNALVDMKVQLRVRDVPMTAVHMSETESLIIVHNHGDETNISWTVALTEYGNQPRT